MYNFLDTIVERIKEACRPNPWLKPVYTMTVFWLAGQENYAFTTFA
jgi:hypothetical protein